MNSSGVTFDIREGGIENLHVRALLIHHGEVSRAGTGKGCAHVLELEA
jgi:hypothetical protein